LLDAYGIDSHRKFEADRHDPGTRGARARARARKTALALHELARIDRN